MISLLDLPMDCINYIYLVYAFPDLRKYLSVESLAITNLITLDMWIHKSFILILFNNILWNFYPL